ncbi:MAG: hypothetical protein Q8Q15_03905 [bacterium]|nr:hypothetical protein [bacterium]
MSGRTERPVFVPKGGRVEIVLEGGPTIDIKNISGSSVEIKQEFPTSLQAQRERLKSRFPTLLEAFIKASANQHGYRLLGGNDIGGEMDLDEAGNKLEEYFKVAQEAGILSQEVIETMKDVLKQVTIASPKMGKPGFLVKEVTAVVEGLVNSAWKKD